MKQFALALLMLLTGFASLTAQEKDIFHIRIGTFEQPRAEDFSALRTLGFVYADYTDAQTARVYLGDYKGAAPAEKIAADLRNRGYLDADAEPVSRPGSPTVYLVQVAGQTVENPVKWDRFAAALPLAVLIENGQLKIASGPYDTEKQAKERLETLRANGFAGAFVRAALAGQVHPVGRFETGGTELLPPAPPRDTAKAAPKTPPSSRSAPVAEEQPAPTRDVPPPFQPQQKRRSVLDLQTLLKSAGFYAGSLDGYFTTTTRAAVERAAAQDARLKRYTILMQHLPPAAPEKENTLQEAVNNLPEQPEASLRVLESAPEPVARAYRAYWYATHDGKPELVNRLMAEAVKDAFEKTKPAQNLPFDPSATYDYGKTDQLVQHLCHVQLAARTPLEFPCWLFDRHYDAVTKALEPRQFLGDDDYAVEPCDPFLRRDEFRLLETIVNDLDVGQPGTDKTAAAAYDRFNQHLRSRLFVVNKPPDDDRATRAEAWNKQLFEGLAAWASTGPLQASLCQALQITYLHALVRAEDHFLNKGMLPRQARSSALLLLQSIVSYKLGGYY